jgi:Predicted signal-transduction protein containing cAMP-binding and CBS domains
MRANEIMTPTPATCSSSDSVQDIARLMRDKDCGAVPVVDNGRVVGIVTDRDLAIRALADGKGMDAKASDVMTAGPQCCSPEDEIRDIEQLMAERQVRRIPIVDAEGRCVGIVSQADLARASKNTGVSDREVAIVVEAISQPAGVQSSRGIDRRM